MKHPLAYIKHDSSLLSLALPGNDSDVDIFLTEVYGDDNSLIWSTFPERKRLGVDTNGKLEFDYEVASPSFPILQQSLNCRFLLE